MASSSGGQRDFPEMSSAMGIARARPKRSSASLRERGRSTAPDNTADDTGDQPHNSGNESGFNEDESIQYEFREVSRVRSDVPSRPDELKADKKTIRYIVQRQDATELKLERFQETADERHNQTMDILKSIRTTIEGPQGQRRISGGQIRQIPNQNVDPDLAARQTSTQEHVAASTPVAAVPTSTPRQRQQVPLPAVSQTVDNDRLPPVSRPDEDLYDASPRRRLPYDNRAQGRDAFQPQRDNGDPLRDRMRDVPRDFMQTQGSQERFGQDAFGRQHAYDQDPFNRQNDYPSRPDPFDNPYREEDRFRRQDTPYSAPGISAGGRRLKRDDIGIFDPYYPDPNDEGLVMTGKDVVYTDVYQFSENIRTYLEDASMRASYEQQIIHMWLTLLGGKARTWWSNQVRSEDRAMWRSRGLMHMLGQLERRFSPDIGVASRKFNQSFLTIRDVAKDEAALDKFFSTKLRHARVMRIYQVESNNWLGAVHNIWESCGPEIKQYLRAPAQFDTLDSYFQLVEHQGPAVASLAWQLYPQYAPRNSLTNRRLDYSGGNDRPFTWKEHHQGRQDKQYRSSRYQQDRRQGRTGDYTPNRRIVDERRMLPAPENRQDSRGKDRDYRDKDRKQYQDKDRRYPDKRQDDRRQTRAYVAEDRGSGEDDIHDDATSESHSGVSDLDSLKSSDDESEREAGYMVDQVLDSKVTCHRCLTKFGNRHLLRSHVEKCRRANRIKDQYVNVNKPSADPARRTCAYCHKTHGSRNRLFVHLRAGCSSQTPESEEPVEATYGAYDLPVEAVDIPVGTKVRRAPKLDKQQSDKLSYTYLRVKARSRPDAHDVEICCDPGSGRTIVGKRFLETLEHTIETRHATLSGVGKGKTKVTEWAKFSVYLPGKGVQGPEIMRFDLEGWVMPELAPNLLIGNMLLDPHAAIINYETHTLNFQKLQFQALFQVQLTAIPCVRRVENKKKVIIMPAETVYLAAEYKPLPSDRDFMFESSHDVAVNSLVDNKTPQVVVATNTTNEPVVVRKHAKLGTIKEKNTGNGFFASTWKAAFSALAVAATLPAQVASMTTGLGNGMTTALETAPVCPGAEFNLTPLTHAIATDSIADLDSRQTTDMTALATAEPTIPTDRSTDTPLLDAVYNMINTASEPVMDIPGVQDLRQNERTTALGIRKPVDVPEARTPEGVYIYAADPAFVHKLKKVVAGVPTLWIDKGPIDVPLEDQMKIPLVDGWQNHKLNSRPYPLSVKDRKLLDDVYDKLHAQGRMSFVNQPTPFAHPVFVVHRTYAEGKELTQQQRGRAVVDLRALNRVAVPDNYPLPLQAEVISSIRGRRFVSILDATSFFHQFLVHPAFRNRFTMVTARGLEQSHVAMMGFRNSPAYAQRFMDRLLDDHKDYCRAFIDDIVVFSETMEDHIQHLTTIFDLFVSKNIAFSPQKSHLGYPSIELLGYKVDSLGMATTAQRLEALGKLAFPRNLTALEQYLGATGFLRHLVPYYAQFAEPLQKRKTQLLAAGRTAGEIPAGNLGKRQAYCRKATFEPSPEELASFDELQKALTSYTMVYHHDPDRQLYIQVDGSLERGFGVMLFHTKPSYLWTPGTPIPSAEVQPIMFMSRSLTPAEQRYGPSELEVAALVWASKRARTVIQSCNEPPVVLTDHSATKGIIEQTSLNTTSTDRANRRLVNASIYLSQYQYRVFHLAGRLNLVPDALSRLKTKDDRPEDDKVILDDIWLTTEALMDDDLRRRLAEAYGDDAHWRPILDELRQPANEVVSGDTDQVFRRPGYMFEIVNGLLYHVEHSQRRRLCIPQTIVRQFLEAAHDDKHHFGQNRMLKELEGLAIRKKTYLVKKYVQHCPTCEVNQTDRNKPAGDYQPVRHDAVPMKTIAIDFIVGLPSVDNKGTPWQLKTNHTQYDQLMTVSCPVSKRTALIPGHATYTAKDWGTALTQFLVLADWGIPSGIVSDRDRKFTSEFWKGLWSSLGTKLLMTTAYHPQADGLSERKNQTVEIAIRCHQFEHPDEPWIDAIPSLQWNLNNAHNSSTTDMSAHEYLFGYKLPGPLEVVTKTGDDAHLPDVRFLRQHIRGDAQLAMDFAAAQAKLRYDNRHRLLEFNVGDMVFLRLHRGYHLPGRPSKAYSQQRAGPYKVLERIGRLAYRLDIPPNSRIHPVISIAHLSPSADGEDPFQRSTPPPGPVRDDQPRADDEYEVETILKHRRSKRKGGLEYLLKWLGYGHEHNVWQHETDLAGATELIGEYWERHGGVEAQQRERGLETTERRRGRQREAKD